MKITVTPSVSVVYRAELLHFQGDPDGAPDALVHHPDGLLWVEDGHIRAVGSYHDLAPRLPTSLARVDYRPGLLVPGFIDTHTHFPQLEVIASYGEQLLDWLERYVFPNEQRFADRAYADAAAGHFLDTLLSNGTTTALVFGSIHEAATDALFQAAQQRRLRLIAGKALMERNAPSALCEVAEEALASSQRLIQRWHGVDRLQYALSPRFAPSCSASLLAACGQLWQRNPGVYLHTHLSENRQECQWVAELFPEADDYLDVYDRAGLVGKRAVFAHGIHLSEREAQRLGAADCAVAFCPSSNSFLGSGLLPWRRLREAGVRLGLGSDIGAGTRVGLLENMGEAYKLQQLAGEALLPLQLWYLATRGGARALDLDGVVGSFDEGAEADFLCLYPQAMPLLAQRYATAADLPQRLFALALLGEERVIRATHLLGQPVDLPGQACARFGKPW